MARYATMGFQAFEQSLSTMQSSNGRRFQMLWQAGEAVQVGKDSFLYQVGQVIETVQVNEGREVALSLLDQNLRDFYRELDAAMGLSLVLKRLSGWDWVLSRVYAGEIKAQKGAGTARYIEGVPECRHFLLVYLPVSHEGSA